MTATTTIYVPPKFPATLLVAAGEGPALIFNTDPTNVLYLGDDNSISAGDPLRTIALNGQSSVNVTGEFDLYGICSGAPIAVSKLQGGINILTGTISIIGPVTATVTGSVSITGTPAVTISGTPTVSISGTPNVNITGQSISLDVSAQTVTINPAVGAIFSPGAISQIAALGTQSIAASGSVSTAILAVSTYLSYDFNITAFCGSQGTANAPLNFQVLVQWFADNLGATPLFQERWFGWLGNSLGNASVLECTGPMHGPFMKVTIFNNQPSLVAYTLQGATFWGTQRTSSQSDWRQSVPGGMTTGLSTIGAYGTPGDDNLLFEIDGSALGASQTLWQPFPLCTGLQFIRFRSSTILNKDFVVSNFAGNVNGGLGTGGTGTPGIVWDAGTAAAEETTTYWTAHAPAWCIISTTASGATLSMMVTGSRGAR